MIALAIGMTAALTLAYGQPQLKGYVTISKPAILDRDILKESESKTVLQKPYGQDGRKTGLAYWTVFSDRNENPVYMTADGKNVCGKLMYGEKLRIAEIKDGYALVYYDPKNDYPKISANAESKGWIPITHLLLWDKVLTDDIGISQKAVICADLDKKGNLKENSRHLRYESPNAKVDGKSFQADMHFYYILKRESGRVLLGYNANIHGGNDLFGWVDESSYVAWNYRTCLEPTWDIDDVESFYKDKDSWKVYPDRNNMKGSAPAQENFKITLRKADEKTPIYREEYKYRNMPKSYLRYPILDGSDNETYHCTTFGVLDENRRRQAEKDKSTADDDYQKALDRLAERKIVNIVIVIDGTSSMQPYFNSVKKALNEVEKYFDDQKVNVGVMIYRDKEDKAYVTECFPATGGFTEPKNQNLRKWLDSGGKYGVRSIAPGNTESVFYGINQAIDQFFPATKDMKHQSNIMLVIGDCGDNGKISIDRETIIDKLAAQNISLMGFQVTNKDSEDYSSFNENLTFLMRSSVQKRYDRMSSKPQRIRPKRLENGRGYDMNNSEGPDIILGMHRYSPVKNVPMPSEDLTNSIEEIVGIWKKNVEYLNTEADKIIQRGDDTEGNQLILDAIIDMLDGNKELVERLKRQNALISFKGYAYKQQNMRDIFKIVVFFPAGELKNLVRDMEKVYEASKNETADRRPYYNAMMNLAKTAVAQNQISSTSYYAILAKVFGLATYTPKYNYTLDDIVDPNVVPYKEYRKIVKDMQQSIERLKNVTSTDYPFLLEYSLNNDKYYWLPSEYLPL